MPATLQDLEKRMADLEREMTRLRRMVERPPEEETPAERGARLIRQAKAGQAALSAGWARAMARMGIHGQPIGAERLQQMIASSGVRPEDNEFSRGIIEMREE